MWSLLAGDSTDHREQARSYTVNREMRPLASVRVESARADHSKDSRSNRCGAAVIICVHVTGRLREIVLVRKSTNT